MWVTYMMYRNQKAQGIVEYALILAFVVGVAVALFNSNGLANAIGKAFYEVSETINNAIDDSPAAKQKRMQNTLEEGLINAIKANNIILGVGDWVELDAQTDPHGNYGYVDGGAKLNSSTLKVRKDANSPYTGYGKFDSLWGAANIPDYKVSTKQDSGWVGVRIVNENGQYVTHYYKGEQSSVGSVGVENYKQTSYMDKMYKDGDTRSWSK